ncbi:beta-caryophyllene synthase [Tanacetum coccineum]
MLNPSRCYFSDQRRIMGNRASAIDGKSKVVHCGGSGASIFIAIKGGAGRGGRGRDVSIWCLHSSVHDCVTPSVVDMTVEMEKISSLEKIQHVLDIFPPIVYAVIFCTLFTPGGNGIDVVVPVESIRVISERFANTTYSFFLEKRVAYPVVANYVRNTWGTYGLVRSMFSSSTGLFFFQFSSMGGFDAMLENGSWFIQNNPLILKKYHPNVNLLKDNEFSITVQVGGVKLYGVLSSYSRAMIALRADLELKDNIVVAMPKITEEGHYTCNIRVEYEWKPPSGNKKKGVDFTNKVSDSNPFEVLNSVDNAIYEMGNAKTYTNKDKKAISSDYKLANPLKSLLETKEWILIGNGDYDEDTIRTDRYDICEGHDLTEKRFNL